MNDLELIQEVRHTFNSTRGQLFQMVESWGRPLKQENAMKGLIRHLTYHAQGDLEAALRGRNGDAH